MDMESWKANYLYGDMQEVERALQAPRPTAAPRDPWAALSCERWESLIRQGAFFKALGRVNWRVVPDAPRIPVSLLDEIRQMGTLLETFLRGLEKHLKESAFLRRELGFPACPQEEMIWELECCKPLEMIRLDLAMEKGEHPRVLEIQVVMGGLGITHALRQTYGPHRSLPGILPMYENCLRRNLLAIEGSESGLAAVLGAKRSAYRHEHLLLARNLSAVGLVVAPLLALNRTAQGGLALPDGREVNLIHRLFRSPGVFRSSGEKAAIVLEALVQNKIRLLNPWKDVLEDKRVLALVHHPEAGEHLGNFMDSRQIQMLRTYIPATWRATPKSISPMLNLPTSQRTYYLKKGRSYESRALFHGRQLSSRQWQAACLKAKAEGDWVIQKEVDSRPWEWKYLDPSSGTMRTMEGYVRLCPFFFRDSEGRMKLADILITAREQSSRVHGATDAVLTVPGAEC